MKGSFLFLVVGLGLLLSTHPTIAMEQDEESNLKCFGGRPYVSLKKLFESGRSEVTLYYEVISGNNFSLIKLTDYAAKANNEGDNELISWISRALLEKLSDDNIIEGNPTYDEKRIGYAGYRIKDKR